MSTQSDLKAAYDTAAALISDDLSKKEALHLIDRWNTAVTEQAALEATEIFSYTIAGRTYTRRNMKDGQEHIDLLQGQIKRKLYGRVILRDLNQNESEPEGTT